MIIAGDCIEVLKTIASETIDLVFADPPYNLQLKPGLTRPEGGKVEGVKEDWDKFDSFEHYDNFCKEWIAECRRVLKPSGTIWISGSYHNIFRIGSILQDLQFWILNDIIWIKHNPMPNFLGKRFTAATETLIWAKKNKDVPCTFNYQLMKELNGGKQMRSDWYIPTCTGNERIKDLNGNKAHPTQKPVELLKRIILASTKEGDLVLDPFGGTGTTAYVAKMYNRDFIIIEKDLDYITVIKERLNNDSILEIF